MECVQMSRMRHDGALVIVNLKSHGGDYQRRSGGEHLQWPNQGRLPNIWQIAFSCHSLVILHTRSIVRRWFSTVELRRRW
jgi:hypothetical protein